MTNELTVGFDENDRNMGWYRLDGKTPVKCSLMEQARARGEGWRVGLKVVGDISISTVFLGMDHDYTGHGPPLLFETMTFGGGGLEGMWRCSTWEQAEQMHLDAIKVVRTILTARDPAQIEDKSDE